MMMMVVIICLFADSGIPGKSHFSQLYVYTLQGTITYPHPAGTFESMISLFRFGRIYIYIWVSSLEGNSIYCIYIYVSTGVGKCLPCRIEPSFLTSNTDSKEPWANHANRLESREATSTLRKRTWCVYVFDLENPPTVGFYSQNHLSFYGLIIPTDSELETFTQSQSSRQSMWIKVLSQSPRKCFGTLV